MADDLIPDTTVSPSEWFITTGAVIALLAITATLVAVIYWIVSALASL